MYLNCRNTVHEGSGKQRENICLYNHRNNCPKIDLATAYIHYLMISASVSEKPSKEFYYCKYFIEYITNPIYIGGFMVQIGEYCNKIWFLVIVTYCRCSVIRNRHIWVLYTVTRHKKTVYYGINFCWSYQATYDVSKIRNKGVPWYDCRNDFLAMYERNSNIFWIDIITYKVVLDCDLHYLVNH